MRRSAAFTLVFLGFCSVAWGAERLVPASSANAYEYQLVRFYHGDFEDNAAFEAWLNDFGRKGWFSIFHFGGANPRNDQRLLMRPVGEPPLEVEFDIKQNEKAFSSNVQVWVREFSRLGKRGKIPVAQFTQGGKTYAVTEAHTLDDELRTWELKRRFAGRRHELRLARLKRALKKQAEDGFVPLAIGFVDRSPQANRYVVGLKETTADMEKEVELKFGEANLATTPSEWTKLINKRAKNGYQLVEVELSDNTGTNFIVIFARVEIDEEFTRRKCVVEPILLGDLNRTVERLNVRGAAGYEKILETFAGGVNSFQFVLCRDE